MLSERRKRKIQQKYAANERKLMCEIPLNQTRLPFDKKKKSKKRDKISLPLPQSAANNAYTPLGFVIVKQDSELMLEDSQRITWCQFCFQSGCNSLIFHEHWLTHFFFPLMLTLGLALILWAYNDKCDRTLRYKTFDPVAVELPSKMTGFILILASIGLWLGTFGRHAGIVVFSICVTLLGILMLCLLCGLTILNSSSTAIDQILQELFSVYGRAGQERLTEIFDHIQIQFKCCGISRPEDWLRLTTINPFPNTTSLPNSCCCFDNIGSIKCPNQSCSFTTDTTTVDYFNFHKKSCVNEVSKFMQKNVYIRAPHFVAAGLVLVLQVIFASLYTIRVYARLANEVHPHVRTLVHEITDKVDHDIFGHGAAEDEPLFDEQVREFVRYNLLRCKDVEEAQEFLTATNDVTCYIRSLEPRNLARDILSGSPAFLKHYEPELRSMQIQSENRAAELQDQSPEERYQRLLRARKDIHFLSRRVRHYTSFQDRFKEY